MRIRCLAQGQNKISDEARTIDVLFSRRSLGVDEDSDLAKGIITCFCAHAISTKLS